MEALAGPSRLIARQVARPRCRLQSTSSKISSVPFRLPPAAGAHKLHMNGLIATAQMSNLIYAGLLKLFGPGIAPYAKEFGLGENLTMLDMKAIYWPAWRCDVLMEGKEDGKGKGNPFAPLSYLSFAVPPVPDDIPQYTEAELKQLGEGYDIVPVPFTVSPFKAFEKLRRQVGRRAKLEDIAVDESEWSEVMTACYPLYLPIYVAEFEHKQEEGKRRFSVVMDAHDSVANNCRASWAPPREIFDTGRFTGNYFVNPAPFLPYAQLIVPVVRSATMGPPISSNSLSNAYTSWISPAPSSHSSIPPSPLVDITDSIPWDDPRIQSWTGPERDQNGDFAEQCLATWKGIAALQGIAQLKSQLKEGADPQGMVVSMKPGEKPSLQPKPMSEITKQMEADVEKMKAELLGAKPSWLIEWESKK